jgi:hypothetical protein
MTSQTQHVVLRRTPGRDKATSLRAHLGGAGRERNTSLGTVSAAPRFESNPLLRDTANTRCLVWGLDTQPLVETYLVPNAAVALPDLGELQLVLHQPHLLGGGRAFVESTGRRFFRFHAVRVLREQRGGGYAFHRRRVVWQPFSHRVG